MNRLHHGIFVRVKSILRNNQQVTYCIRDHSTSLSCCRQRFPNEGKRDDNVNNNNRKERQCSGREYDVPSSTFGRVHRQLNLLQVLPPRIAGKTERDG